MMRDNSRLQRILSLIIAIILTLALTIYGGRLLDPASSGEIMDSITAFHNLPDNSLEVIMYGSSHTWKGCDTAHMYDQYGISVYNYGGNWQCINTTLLFVQDSLKTQSPKVALIDTYKVDEVKQDSDLDGQIYYTKALPDSLEKRAFLKKCFGKSAGRYISYYYPFTIFHSNWNRLAEQNFEKSNPDKWIATRGYAGSTDIVETDFTFGGQTEQLPIPEESREYLDEMVRLLKENGTEVVFYTCPWFGENPYADAFREYATTNGCEYIDLFDYIDEMGMDATDFRDVGHLNDSGSKKVADILGQYVTDNYDLTDCRITNN